MDTWNEHNTWNDIITQTPGTDVTLAGSHMKENKGMYQLII